LNSTSGPDRRQPAAAEPVIAAALPVAVGGFAILGSLAVLRAVTLVTDVSIFALNLTVAMGLALAIDYTLLIVSRFRDELADGAGREEALVRTMATAGRTVLFSAVTVTLSMLGVVLFPTYFLKSFAYAGIATVAFAAVASVVVTPGGDCATRGSSRFVGCAPSGPADSPPAGAGASPGRADLLVSLDEVRDAPRDSDRTGDHCATTHVRGAVPGHQVGLPRRPRAAAVAVGPPGRRRTTQRFRRRLRDQRHRRDPRHARK